MTLLREELSKNSAIFESYALNAKGIAIALLDADLKILDCNLGFMRLFQPREKPFNLPLSVFLEYDDSTIRSNKDLKLSFSRSMKKDGILECYLNPSGDGFVLFCERMVLSESQALEKMSQLNNELIDLQRESVKKNLLLERLQQELSERIRELESALGQVKQLEGIIPICMYCKKIRDKNELWNNVENYIARHSEAHFSHGICPLCLEEHYPEIQK